jgi:Spore coat protein
MTHTQSNLSEKEILNDALSSEKQLLHVYSTYLAEASCPNLRNELTRVFNETQQMQFELYKAMEQKGWYTIQNAELQQVQQAVNKFSQEKNNLQ